LLAKLDAPYDRIFAQMACGVQCEQIRRRGELVCPA